MKLPVLFINGPSGVGKGYISEYFARTRKWQWFELDAYSGSGVDELGLRGEWDRVWSGEPVPFLDEVKRRANKYRTRGAIVSLPGTCLFPPHIATALQRAGALFIFLWGTEEQCLGAFLERERGSGRRLEAGHWRRNNAGIFAFAGSPKFQGQIVNTFDANESRRAPEEICAEIEALAGDGNGQP